MADPVQDAFGPVLRRIQEHLVRLEQKFDAHAVRIEERMSDVEKAASVSPSATAMFWGRPTRWT